MTTDAGTPGLIALLAAAAAALLYVQTPASSERPRSATSAASREIVAVERLAVPWEAGEAWPTEALSDAERAVVDRGRDVAGWDEVHRRFAEVVPLGAEEP